MARVVAIVGVDGCGKSSAWRGAVAALAERLRVVGIGECVIAGGPGEEPHEQTQLPRSRVARILGRTAKSLRWQALYGNLKVLELAQRASLRRSVVAHARPDVVLTDGDPLINTTAWAIARFYRRELANHDATLLRVLGHLAGEPMSPGDLWRFGRRGWQLAALSALRLGPFESPDVAVLLDVEPAIAMARIRARGKPLQAHETEAFLATLGQAYARVCNLLEAHRGVRVLRVRADELREDDVVRTVVQAATEPLTGEPRLLDREGIYVVATTMSGSIKDQQKVDLIEPTFLAHTERAVQVRKANSHAEARSLAHDLVSRGGRLLVSAGGAGTFNAVLEGARLDGLVPADLRLAFLRKGSADLIGKALGIPDDLKGAVQAIVQGIDGGFELPASVLTVEAAAPGGRPLSRHVIGFGGLGVFGEVPRFTEARWIKFYKGILGALFGDLGPFFVGLPLATVSWQIQRVLGRVPPLALTLDDDAVAADVYSAILILNGDLGREFPLGRGLALGSPGFRVVALRYRGLRVALEQVQACRRATVLDDPERYGAIVRTVRRLVVRPLGSRPYLVNVDGLRMAARGPVRVSVAGQVRLIASPSRVA